MVNLIIVFFHFIYLSNINYSVHLCKDATIHILDQRILMKNTLLHKASFETSNFEGKLYKHDAKTNRHHS